MPAVPGGRPARPIGQRPAGQRRRSPPGTPRPALPAFPSGRAGPPARTRPAAQLARGAFPLFLVPRAGRPGPGPAVAIPTGAGLDAAGGAERPSSRTHGRAAPGNANRSRPAPRYPGRSTRNPGRPAADHRGGDRRAAGIPGRLLPLAPARRRAGSGAAAWTRGAGPAQRAQRVAAPPGRTGHARRTGEDSRWTVTTSGSGTSRRSATAPQPATGSGGRSTAVSTASLSRPARWPTGSSPA